VRFRAVKRNLGYAYKVIVDVIEMRTYRRLREDNIK
jgi:hypothetical protein